LHKGAKLFYLPPAALFFVLAAVGVFIPGLPTTQFLLLTSYFLVRSSPRLNARLQRSRFFGTILMDWHVHGGIRRDVKEKAVSIDGMPHAVLSALHNGLHRKMRTASTRG
jgi:uncharacterized membrane protein YbaN (DUF454 family)